MTDLLDDRRARRNTARAVRLPADPDGVLTINPQARPLAGPPPPPTLRARLRALLRRFTATTRTSTDE